MEKEREEYFKKRYPQINKLTIIYERKYVTIIMESHVKCSQMSAGMQNCELEISNSFQPIFPISLPYNFILSVSCPHGLV